MQCDSLSGFDGAFGRESVSGSTGAERDEASRAWKLSKDPLSDKSTNQCNARSDTINLFVMLVPTFLWTMICFDVVIEKQLQTFFQRLNKISSFLPRCLCPIAAD